MRISVACTRPWPSPNVTLLTKRYVSRLITNASGREVARAGGQGKRKRRRQPTPGDVHRGHRGRLLWGHQLRGVAVALG